MLVLGCVDWRCLVLVIGCVFCLFADFMTLFAVMLLCIMLVVISCDLLLDCLRFWVSGMYLRCRVVYFDIMGLPWDDL